MQSAKLHPDTRNILKCAEQYQRSLLSEWKCACNASDNYTD